MTDSLPLKGEKADSVYPRYGRDPEDPADTMTIRRIPWQYGEYHGDTEDICRAKSIKRNRIMKIQNLHDRAIRSRGEKRIPSIRDAATIHTVQRIRWRHSRYLHNTYDKLQILRIPYPLGSGRILWTLRISTVSPGFSGSQLYPLDPRCIPDPKISLDCRIRDISRIQRIRWGSGDTAIRNPLFPPCCRFYQT